MAPGLVALQLLPNGHFRDGEAGQFVLVTVQIDGVNHQRAYSLVSAPGERPLRLGVRVQGRVSRHLATKVSVGDVLEFSQPQGELVLTAGKMPSAKRLFILGCWRSRPHMACCQTASLWK